MTITFEGKQLNCRPDTTVAVALWENGIRHLSHSHKYGHDRGVSCARSHCTSCLMRVDGVPNVRTCELKVAPGMTIEKQDTGAFYGPPMQKVLSVGGNLFPVGFYYKWFTKPAVLSRAFLSGIRPMTGVGRIPNMDKLPALPPADDSTDKDQMEVSATELGHFDTVVVGAGPSGLEQALETSGQVLIIDEHDQPGGQRYLALKELAETDNSPLDRFPVLAGAWRRLRPLVEKFQAERGTDFRGGLRCIAGYSPNGLLLRDEHSLFTSSFSNLVWTAGALDSLGLFPGNDTPGVMGPRALYRLLTRDGLQVQGQQALVIGSGLDVWLCSALLAQRGAKVSLVVTGGGWQSEVSGAVDMGWQLTTGLKLANIHSQGEQSLEAVFVPVASSPGPLDSHLNLKADFAVVCGRGKPAYDIPYQLGADLTLQPENGGFLPRGVVDDENLSDLPGGNSLAVYGEAFGKLPEDLAAPARKGDNS